MSYSLIWLNLDLEGAQEDLRPSNLSQVKLVDSDGSPKSLKFSEPE